MATVYKFEVTVVSAFCAFPPAQISDVIKEALEKYQDECSGLKLESIKITP